MVARWTMVLAASLWPLALAAQEAAPADPPADATPAADAQAEQKLPLGDVQAQAMLYPYDTAVLDFVPNLGISGPALAQIRKATEGEGYYGAVAAAKIGTRRIGFAVVSQYHSPPAADAAALAKCAARTKSKACVVIARILPVGWQARPLQMSGAATLMYQERYLRDDGPIAMAVATGGTAAALVQGADAGTKALAACKKGAEKEVARAVRDFDCNESKDGALTCVLGAPAKTCELVLSDGGTP